MSPEKDAALCAKYPEIFCDRNGNMRETAMCWGFECGDGWYNIIDRLCQKLMDLANLPDGTRHVPRASQVKEKYGGLRFYLMSATDEQYKACDEAEQESKRTCERCGAPGKIRGGGWIYAACDEHTDPEDLVDNPF